MKLVQCCASCHTVPVQIFEEGAIWRLERFKEGAIGRLNRLGQGSSVQGTATTLPGGMYRWGSLYKDYAAENGLQRDVQNIHLLRSKACCGSAPMGRHCKNSAFNPSAIAYTRENGRGRALKAKRFAPDTRGLNTRGKVACANQPGSWDALAQMFQSIATNFAQPSAEASNAASLTIDRLSYQPPGAEASLLNDISLHLPASKLGLVYGRSGAGKSTLLQIVSGLAQANSGTIKIDQEGTSASSVPVPLASKVGLVFQFPERHFLGSTLLEELAFGWPSDPWEQQAVKLRLPAILEAVDLTHIQLSTKLTSLSDGYKRRVALAVQLARSPALLLLDEPLAGLDWRARADVAGVLKRLKTRCTILVVSHDLRELVQLVDHAWRMEAGGFLRSSEWPPVTASPLEV